MAGLFVILGAALHRRIAKKIRNFAELFHVLEGLVEIVCASILLEKGKHWIPVFLAFIGLFYLSQGLTQFLTKEKNREKVLVQFRTIQGIVFIAFGAATAALNVLTDRKIEVYGAAAALALGGIIALLRRKSQRKIGVLNKAYTFLNRK